jgi:dsRNA-specific ribonuclease
MLDRCLTLAFLHESYLGVRLPSYERLEFLGDAWLNAVISSRLFELHPKAHEGLLSEMRAALTRNQVRGHTGCAGSGGSARCHQDATGQ